MKKRILSIALVLCMLLTLLPTLVAMPVAADSTLPMNGSWTDTDGTAYALTNGVLTVVGANSDCTDNWFSHFDKSAVKKAVVSNVRSIMTGAFAECEALESVVISDGDVSCALLTNIFNGCDALNTVYIGSSVNKIASGALEAVPGNVDVYYMGTESELKSMFTDTYDWDSNIKLYCKHPHFALGVTETFEDDLVRYTCKCGLSDVLYLSGSWTDEDGNKFTIENDVLTIDGAGGDCGDSWHSYFYRYCVKQVVVKNVKNLNGTFSRCMALEAVELPDGLKVIGDETFFACEALKQIELPNCLESIGYEAFYATGLTSVTIPDSVKTLGGYVFANSKSLESVILGSGCENIPDCAFKECWKLTNIILPEVIKTISDGAFYNCKFARIKLPNSVTFIGANIFGSNPTPEIINIPSGISKLNEYVFYESYGLEKVYIGIETTRIEKMLSATQTSSAAI